MSTFFRKQFSPVLIALLLGILETIAQTGDRPYAFKELAGLPDGQGYVDGPLDIARLRHPTGVSLDPAGNVYLVDLRARRVSSNGVATIPITIGRIYANVSFDRFGNFYASGASQNGGYQILKFSPGGSVTSMGGGDAQWEYGFRDGPVGVSRFNSPQGVAVDTSGNIYVADYANRAVRKISPEGITTTLAGGGKNGSGGTTDGTGPSAQFNIIQNVAVDSQGIVYVTDSGDSVIRKITPSGVVTTIAGSPGHFGSSDGTGTDARFNMPRGVAVDLHGNLYVADTGNFTIRRITPTGTVSTVAGLAGKAGSADGTGSQARFGVVANNDSGPLDVTVDLNDNVFVADNGNSTIRKIAPEGVVTTVVGKAGGEGRTDAQGTDARFSTIMGIAVDKGGLLYVADYRNNEIRTVSQDGTVATLVPFNAMLFPFPWAITIDAAENLYWSNGNSFTKASIKGTGARYFQNVINGSITGLAVSKDGTVYVANSLNYTIERMTTNGTWTIFAGSDRQAGSRDGLGSEAEFGSSANSIAIDDQDFLYVTDPANFTIRRISSEGLVTTIAGKAGQSGTTDGKGDVARFKYPASIAISSAGDLYVADLANPFQNYEAGTIRKITRDGTVTTIVTYPAGSGIAIAVDRDDQIYLARTFTISKGVPLDFWFDIHPISLNIASNTFQAHVTGPVGSKLTVESSTNLLTWTSLLTNAAPDTDIFLPTLNRGRQFLRARIGQ